jgi:hypothetical protein
MKRAHLCGRQVQAQLHPKAQGLAPAAKKGPRVEGGRYLGPDVPDGSIIRAIMTSYRPDDGNSKNLRNVAKHASLHALQPRAMPY